MGTEKRWNLQFALYPTNADVVLGRGRPYQEYVGNVRLAELVDQVRNKYLATTNRLEKTFLTMKIYNKIAQEGGYFLQRVDDGWEVVDDSVARGKISHCFRTKTVRNTPDPSGSVGGSSEMLGSVS